MSCFEGEDTGVLLCFFRELRQMEQLFAGDNWEVICDDDFWHRSAEVKFKHVDTGTFLSVPGHKYGRPIAGQMEVGST